MPREFARGGLATGVMVAIVDVLIWRHYVPNVCDVRTATPYNTDVEAAERMALTAGTIFTLIAALYARSMEVFAIGGLVLVALDFSTKYANAVNPDTGKLASAQAQTNDLTDSFPMPDYATSDAG
jgi:hypothetical protein